MGPIIPAWTAGEALPWRPDQDGGEWVAVLQGEATLEFAHGRLLEMRAGDWVSIPAHVRHRVQRTGTATIWLAVHAGNAN